MCSHVGRGMSFLVREVVDHTDPFTVGLRSEPKEQQNTYKIGTKSILLPVSVYDTACNTELYLYSRYSYHMYKRE